jgi:DNA-binding MarR family transcriptional regulator
VVARASVGTGGPGPAPALAGGGELAQELSEDVGFRLGQVHRHLRSSWERSIADLGLSAPQAAALRAATEQPGAAMRGLARILGTDPMNARRLALDLERMGLVAVGASSSDRRAKGVWPTPQGELLASRISRRARTQQQLLRARLGEESYRRLGALLEQLGEVGKLPQRER